MERQGLASISLCLILCIGVATASANAQKSKKKKQKKPEASAVIESMGAPAMGPKDGTRLYVWQDGTSWHIRTNSGVKTRKFSGIVSLSAGKVTALRGMEGLETTGKTKDLGWLSRDKKTIRFEFYTNKVGLDGFDFEVSEEAKMVAFHCKIDGYDQPGLVVIGPRKQPAPTGNFELPVLGPFATPAATDDSNER